MTADPLALTICEFLPDESENSLTLAQILVNLLQQMRDQRAFDIVHDKVYDYPERFQAFKTMPSPIALLDLVDSPRQSISRVFLVLDNPNQNDDILAPLLDAVS